MHRGGGARCADTDRRDLPLRAIVIGVLANTLAIVAGTLVGLLFRRLITDAIAKRIQLAFGFVTIVIGLRMALKFNDPIVFISCLALGGLTGLVFDLEARIERGAKKLQDRITREKESSFATGLTISSILFCAGGMAIVGAINSGVTGDHEVLYAKSLLDGVTATALAGVYGFGVLFSAVPVFLYQGAIALCASKATFLNQPHILAEISGVGGVLVLMIGVNLARISKIPIGDFLPAMLLVLAWALFA
ncbi:MAG: DUF554 domain-containing protein [Pseudomonadota bacterium]